MLRKTKVLKKLEEKNIKYNLLKTQKFKRL